MIIIDKLLISDDVLSHQFVCNLSKCKGACCWEGDFGAPIEDAEMDVIDNIIGKIIPLLPIEHQEKFKKDGSIAWYEDKPGFFGTQLMDDGTCLFMTKDENGIAQCSFEVAWKKGLTEFRKPISCHLYPIRIEKHSGTGLTAVNYDQWDICSAACDLGRDLQIPVYQFAKEALTSKFGEEIYEQIDQYFQQQQDS